MNEKEDRIHKAYFRFERFIDDMPDEDFEDWYDDPDTTDNQRDFADKIRETVSPDETERFFSAP